MKGALLCVDVRGLSNASTKTEQPKRGGGDQGERGRFGDGSYQKAAQLAIEFAVADDIACIVDGIGIVESPTCAG